MKNTMKRSKLSELVSQIKQVLFTDTKPKREDDQPNWEPTINRVETKNAYLIIVMLPDADSDSIKVSRKKDRIVATGERRDTEEVNDNGRFNLSFNILPNGDLDHIEATFVNELLTIRIPKIEKSKPSGYHIDVRQKIS